MRVVLEVVEPDGMLGSAAHRCDDRVQAAVLDPHQGRLAKLAGSRPNRSQDDDRPTAQAIAFSPIRRLV